MAKAPQSQRGKIWTVRFDRSVGAETRFVQRIGTVTNAQLDEIASAVALCVGAP